MKVTSRSVKLWSSPPRGASPVRRSGASAAAPCQRWRDAPDTLWPKLSEQLPARAPSSRPGASAAPPPDTRASQREDCYCVSSLYTDVRLAVIAMMSLSQIS